MSSNYENAVHGGRGRRVSIVTESNANLQQDNRLARELEQIEKEKEKMLRRRSSAGQVIPPMPTAASMKRRTSLAETRMQRTLSKHDLEITPVRARSNSVAEGPIQLKLTRSSSLPYGELLDKERFEKFCSTTRKLSMTSAEDVKSQLNIKEGDQTGFMGDMNVYLRQSNGAARRSSSPVIEEEDGQKEGGIEWENFVHPRTLEQLSA